MNRRRELIIALGMSLAMVPMCAGGALCASEDAELAVIREGCKQAAHSIRSGKGVVTVRSMALDTDGAKRETETSYKVCFSGNRYKYSSDTSFLKNESASGVAQNAKGGKTCYDVAFDGRKVVFQGRESTTDAVIGDLTSRVGKREHSNYQANMNVRRFGVFELDKFVAKGPTTVASEPKLVGRETLDGDECRIVEIVYTTDYGQDGQSVRTYWFWVNPEKGFTVPQLRFWAQGGVYKEKTLLAEMKCEFRQYANGTWGPTKCTEDLFRLHPTTGESYTPLQRVITFSSDYELNAPVTEGELAMHLPSGTSVHDEVLDADYSVE